jgi:mono/diheme cytochrome c family protein
MKIARERADMLVVVLRLLGFGASLTSLLLATACAQQMGSQPHLRPLEQSPVFANGQSARPLVAGTVPSGFTRTNHRVEDFATFDPNSDALGVPLTKELLERGRERFNIYCSECHGRTGEGDGIVVSRGFSKPPSYFEDRLRQAPLGHFYDVITNGFGAMASYGMQVEPRDRWAIAAYIRTLQLSRNASIRDVPSEKRDDLENGGEKR